MDVDITIPAQSVTIFGQSSVPITMEVSFDGPSPTSYDLFVTIEQLQ